MSTNTITLDVPGPLYEQLKRLAEQTHRSVEEETLEVLATAVPPACSLPREWEEAMQALNGLDDAALIESARNRLEDNVSAELERLHDKQRQEGLSDEESAKLADLVGRYERHMLVRAQAAALLKARGCDLRELMK